MKKTIKDIADIAIVAAIYVALTLALYPLSFGSPQFRISECLVLLTYYQKKYGIGVTIGVLIANFFNPQFMIFDVIFGTLSTAIAVLLISFTKKLFIASLWPTLTSFIVAIEISLVLKLPFWLTALEVVGSMFIIESIIGFSLFKILEKNKGFMRVIKPEGVINNEVQNSGTEKEIN